MPVCCFFYRGLEYLAVSSCLRSVDFKAKSIWDLGLKLLLVTRHVFDNSAAIEGVEMMRFHILKMIVSFFRFLTACLLRSGDDVHLNTIKYIRAISTFSSLQLLFQSATCVFSGKDLRKSSNLSSLHFFYVGGIAQNTVRWSMSCTWTTGRI